MGSLIKTRHRVHFKIHFNVKGSVEVKRLKKLPFIILQNISAETSLLRPWLVTVSLVEYDV